MRRGYKNLEPAPTDVGTAWKVLLVVAFVALVPAYILGGFGTAAYANYETVPERDLLDSMNRLFDAFLQVDAGFNDPGRFNASLGAPSYGLGLSISEIAALGYFEDRSTVIAHGPFETHATSEMPFFHANHSNLPGAFQSFGNFESAYLQTVFEGSLFMDVNFPWFPDATLAPRVYHRFPKVIAYLGYDRMTVSAAADVTWGPLAGNNANVTNGGIKVAQVGSLAQYKINRDASGNVLIPSIDWIHFTIRYED